MLQNEFTRTRENRTDCTTTEPEITQPPEGMVIGENAEEDARRFYLSEEGIVLVTREMLRKLGHKQER